MFGELEREMFNISRGSTPCPDELVVSGDGCFQRELLQQQFMLSPSLNNNPSSSRCFHCRYI